MDLCSKSSCAVSSKEKTERSNAQNKGSNEKAFLQSEGAKNLNLNDLVASTPEGHSPVVVDTQMVTQSHTSNGMSTSTPPVETPNKKDNVEKITESSNKQRKVSDVNEKKTSDKVGKKKGSGEKVKKNKKSDKQEKKKILEKQAKLEKPS
uniref:Uncharacterized protein n=1 Tax=Ditylenchus dipsaci TaxID=166011 RepID=A0A915EQM9_9BILA